MSDYKLWTDGKDVFVVPVKELPVPFNIGMIENYEGHADLAEREYEKALEAAKQKHSVRVENCEVTKVLKLMIVTNKTSKVLLKGEGDQDWTNVELGTLYDLPEGHEVKQHGVCEGCNTVGLRHCAHADICGNNQVFATILPVEKQESEDEQAKMMIDILRRYSDNPTVETMNDLKSKYTITRRS